MKPIRISLVVLAAALAACRAEAPAPAPSATAGTNSPQAAAATTAANAGLRDAEAPNSLHFEDFAHILAAAREGLGLCLGDMITTGADLAAGRLVRPFEQSVEGLAAYFLIAPSVTSPAARLFADWLEAEMVSFVRNIH